MFNDDPFITQPQHFQLYLLSQMSRELMARAEFMRNFLLSNPPAMFTAFLGSQVSRAHIGKEFDNELTPYAGCRNFNAQARPFAVDHDLTNAQQQAIEQINGLRVMPSIHGPPGAGKTTLIAWAMKARDTTGLGSHHTAIVAETNLATINLAV